MTLFQTVMILYVTAQFGLTLYQVGLRGIHAMASSRAASSRCSLLYAVDLRNKHYTVYNDILFRSMPDLNWILSADRRTARQRLPVTEQSGDLSVVAGDGLRPLECLAVPVHRRRHLVLADQFVAFLLQLLRHLVSGVER